MFKKIIGVLLMCFLFANMNLVVFANEKEIEKNYTNKVDAFKKTKITKKNEELQKEKELPDEILQKEKKLPDGVLQKEKKFPDKVSQKEKKLSDKVKKMIERDKITSKDNDKKSFSKDDNNNMIIRTESSIRNDINSPYYINVGSTYSGLSINPSGDEDFFKFTAPNYGVYSIYTTGSTDTYGYLMSSSGNTTYASNDDAGPSTNFMIKRTLTAGRTYMIKVRGYNSRTTGSYTITVEPEVSPDQYENNDSVSSATSIPHSNNTVFYYPTLHTFYDVDYFKFTINVKSGLDIDMTSIPSGRDYDMRLYNDRGNTLASAVLGGSLDENISTDNLLAGTYYIKVYSHNGFSDSNTYRLAIKLEPHANPDQYEINDSMSTATTINSGTNLYPTLHTDNDIDYFKFSIDTMSSLELDMTSIPSDTDYNIILYDSNGNTIESSLNGSNRSENIDEDSLLAGTYYIKVYSYRNSTDSNTYKLAIELETHANPDEYESNDSMSTATTIDNGTSLYSTLDTHEDSSKINSSINGTSLYSTLHTHEDIDYFKFDISSISGIEIDLTNIPSNTDYDIILYDSDGTQIAYSEYSSNSSENIKEDNLPAGKYYIKVYSFTGYSDSIAYKLYLAVTSPDITINGRIQYNVYENFEVYDKRNDTDYPNKPYVEDLSNYNISIYDKDLIYHDLLATTTTDADGKFSTTFNNQNFDNVDIFIKVTLDNEIVNITKIGNDGDTYFWNSRVERNLQNATTYDFDTFIMDDTRKIESFMNMYHWIKEGYDFYANNAGDGVANVDNLNLRWEEDSAPGSFYTPYYSSMTLNGGPTNPDQFDSNIILHEYGHHIMSKNDATPATLGGDHGFGAPGEHVGTSYSEGYATFFATQVQQVNYSRNYRIKNDSMGSFGVNLEDLTYLLSSLEFPLDEFGPLNNDHNPELDDQGNPIRYFEHFNYKAGMEGYVGGILYDLADSDDDGDDDFSGGFKLVNDVVTNRRLNSSVEFFEAFMNTVPDDEKDRFWKIFEQNRQALDYEIPTVTILQSSPTIYTMEALDNIEVVRTEWVINDNVVGTGPTIDIDSLRNLRNDAPYYLIARAYDREGDVRGNEVRLPLDSSKNSRTDAYGKASVRIVTSSSRVLSNFNYFNALEKPTIDTNMQLKGVLQNSDEDSSKIKTNLIVDIDDNEDIFIDGSIDGAMEMMELIDENGQIVRTIPRLDSYGATKITGLSKGKYTISLKTVEDIVNVPFYINIYTLPSVPDFDFAKMTNKNDLDFENTTNNIVKLMINNQSYTISPKQKITLHFEEGSNNVKYYSTLVNGTYQSDSKQIIIFVDSIAPTMEIEEIIYTGSNYFINFHISEVSSVFRVNDEDEFIGEFLGDSSFTHSYRIANTDNYLYTVYLEDSTGNIFEKTFNIESLIEPFLLNENSDETKD